MFYSVKNAGSLSLIWDKDKKEKKQHKKLKILRSSNANNITVVINIIVK